MNKTLYSVKHKLILVPTSTYSVSLFFIIFYTILRCQNCLSTKTQKNNTREHRT